MEKTLRDLRLESGKTHEEVVADVAHILGTPRKTERASVLWEFRGIQKGDIQDALAEMYGVSVQTIRAASMNSSRTHGPVLKKGPRKNITITV